MSINMVSKTVESQITEENKSNARREQLVEKVLETKTVVKEITPQKEVTSNINYKSLYRQTKKELDKLKKESSQAQVISKNDEKRLKKAQQEVDKRKKENYELQQRLKIQLDMVKVFESQLVTERNKNIQLEDTLRSANVEKNKYILSFKNLKRRVKAINKEKINLRRKLKNQRNEINKQYGLIDKLRVSLRRKKVKEKLLKEEVSEFLQVTPSFFIRYFLNTISKDNINDFKGLEKLYERYHFIQQALESYKQSQVEISTEVVEEYTYGYLTKYSSLNQDGALNGSTVSSSNQWLFVNSSGKSYVVTSRPDIAIYDGAPASAKLNEITYTANVIRVFKTDDKTENKVTTETKAKPTAKYGNKGVQEDYTYIGPVSVLLVTSKNGIRYRERLSKHGVIADWIDPYEKNHTHILNKSSSYDIVLLMENAMPHTTRDVIAKYGAVDPDKIQTMYEHSEETIVGRVRYTAIKKGLVRIS